MDMIISAEPSPIQTKALPCVVSAVQYMKSQQTSHLLVLRVASSFPPTTVDGTRADSAT